MNTYRPDGYAVIKLTVNNDTIFKVFSSWGGGYLDGDSYRLNSGITKLSIKGNNYYFYGFSGSIVEVNKDATRISAYNCGVLNEFLGHSFVELVEYGNIISELEANGVIVEYIGGNN